MAIDYLRDVKPFEDEGMTDADIAFHLSSRTSKPIECSDAKIALEESGLVYENPVTLERSGTLIDRYNAMTNQQLKALLGWFISHVFGRGSQISSDTSPRAVQLASVIADLPASMQPVAQKLLQLGGGQLDAGTVEADVVAARAVYDADVFEQTRQDTIRTLAEEIENDYINPAVSDGVSTEAQVRAEIKAGL
jgi:hypothetical protein